MTPEQRTRILGETVIDRPMSSSGSTLPGMECDDTVDTRNRTPGERTFPNRSGLTLMPALGEVGHPYIPENLGIALQMTFRDKAFNGKTSGPFPGSIRDAPLGDE